jgi:hypothetical protein
MIKLVSAAAILVAVGTLLAPDAASAQTHSLPLNATFSGAAAFTSQTTTSFTGAGTAILMGQIATVGHALITGSDNTNCTGGIANTNVETLTAANGDTLTISSADVACPTGPGQYHGTGHWVLTGGTGRFSDASGDGSFEGNSDFEAGTFAIQLTGTVVVDY